MKSVQNKTTNTRVFLSIELLKTFTSKELNSFKLFIDNKYLNADTDLPVLLKQLIRYVLKEDKFTLELQLKIFDKLFGEVDKNQTTLDKKQSGLLVNKLNKLLRLAEKFLMFETIKDTDEFDTFLLFPELIKRKQMMLYGRRLKATEKKLSQEKKQGVEYHNQCYNIQHEKARLLFMNKALAKEDNYDELQYHEDIKYLLKKLQYHLAKISLQRRYANKIFNNKPFIALQALLKLPEYKFNPLIQLYVLNIQLVETEKEATFLALLRLLKEKHDFIPLDFLKPFYINLTNHCTHQLAKGDLTYYQYLFEIYNDMDKVKLLVMGKSIELALLKNIITTACRVNIFDWATDKLATYINYVPKTIRSSIFEYHSGIIAFNQQEYDVALSHFAKVRKIDGTHELSLRLTQLQCFYEIDVNHENFTQQLIDSLRTYIHQNKKLTKRQKTGYFNFIRVFNQLYKFNHILDKRSQKVSIENELNKLKAHLLKFELIFLKKWLLDKINDFKSDK